MSRARAMAALASIGASAEGLERADSVTNEVWLTNEYAVRVNRDAGLRLHREAVLSHVLPREVGYPTVIQHGGEIGNDWLIQTRVSGQPLSRWWPSLSNETRRDAVRQLADRLRMVHATRCPNLQGLNEVPQCLDPAPTGSQAVARLLRALDKMRNLPHVDVGVVDDAADLVRSISDSLDPFDGRGIVHGDLTFENLLWDRGQITAVLDFEYARPGPPDLDLDVLLRFVELPQLHVAPDYESETKREDYRDIPWWLAEDYPELFAHPRQFDRMRIYSIAWDVNEILAFPPGGPPTTLHPHHPYRLLTKVLRGTSYLDRLNGAEVLEL